MKMRVAILGLLMAVAAWPQAVETVKVTEASLTYVAVGPDRRPREIAAP